MFKKCLFFMSAVFTLLEICVSCQSQPKVGANKTDKSMLLGTMSPFSPGAVDGLLASVGGQVILFSDFQQAILIASQGQTQLDISGQLTGGSLTSAQADQILQMLVNQKILEIKSSEEGIKIGEDELDQGIKSFLTQRNLSEQDLKDNLKQMGKTMLQYREEFRIEMLKQRMIPKVVSPYMSVTQEDVKIFYLQQSNKNKNINSVTLRSLVIPLPLNYSGRPEDDPSVAAVQKKIQLINSCEEPSGCKEKKMAAFLDAVKKYSMSSDVSMNEGLLSDRPVNQLPKELQNILPKLNLGDITGPIVLGSSVFFFQYISFVISEEEELKKNYLFWKNKLLDIKYNEKLNDYFNAQRTLLKVNIRPFHLYRMGG